MLGVRTKQWAFGWWAHVFFIIAASIARSGTADEPILIITDPPADGRADTAPWMRNLAAWAQVGGPPDAVPGPVKQFADFLGLPVGFHWYNWHEIPFDNDYPHYFPTKAGFPEAVRELQSANVFVMPYINGRLWDTRDKGSEDFEFTAVAKAATKLV